LVTKSSSISSRLYLFLSPGTTRIRAWAPRAFGNYCGGMIAPRVLQPFTVGGVCSRRRATILLRSEQGECPRHACGGQTRSPIGDRPSLVNRRGRLLQIIGQRAG